jgi:ATP-dependent DNA helicase RecG
MSSRGPMLPLDLPELLQTLLSGSTESEWMEFKLNNAKPAEIGEQMSALANASALHKRDRAFIVWGINDDTHAFVGTTFRPSRDKVGNEDLENWLATLLTPHIQFWIYEFESDGKNAVIFEIEPAMHQPIAFKGVEYIRVGKCTKKLRSHPEKERSLWRIFSRESFEAGIAATRVTADEVLRLLSFQNYFSLTDYPVPTTNEAVVEQLCSDGIAQKVNGSRYDITNLGAILFARDLGNFDRLKRKAIRIVMYRNTNRIETEQEFEGKRGYASGFQALISFLLAHVPHSEEIQQALRISVPKYPELALRELAANALIHQDFDISGAGPMIEVFSDRVEFTNPGVPLLDVQRFLDLPPRSRNEKLAHLMRRLKICEERGSGIDKVLLAAEIHQLAPPDFLVAGDNTKAILFAPRTFAQMTAHERIRACYQHAGLQWVSDRQMTNESLRKRFSFSDRDIAKASRVIGQTLAARLIRPYDPSNTSNRYARYIPYWAARVG